MSTTYLVFALIFLLTLTLQGVIFYFILRPLIAGNSLERQLSTYHYPRSGSSWNSATGWGEVSSYQ